MRFLLLWLKLSREQSEKFLHMTLCNNHKAGQIHSEHRVYWASQRNANLPAKLLRLKGFFARFARKQFRNFPWRKVKEAPFHLLLAELLLVQTKADDVARVWPRLVRRDPTPASMANAPRGALIHL